MARNKVSVSGMMGLIGLVAIDLWVYKRIFETLGGTNYDFMVSLCVLGLLPTSTLMLATAALLIARVRRSGAATPFLLGFLICGLLAAVAFVFAWWQVYEYLMVVTLPTPNTTPAVVTPVAGDWDIHLELLLFAGCATIPQLLIATVGGLLFRRFGINIHRSYRTSSRGGDETRPPADRPPNQEGTPRMTLNEDRQDTIVERRVTYTLEKDGRFFLVENVPARVNPGTGEQFFAPETVEQV